MAVRNMLLLPAELRPNQLISLLGLGGPSFPMGLSTTTSTPGSKVLHHGQRHA